MLRQILPTVAVLAGFSAPACAQLPRPIPQNCSGVFRATVESGRPHPRLVACSDEVIPQIAGVVAEAPLHPQPLYLSRVFVNASAYRDPAIARAALELAQNRGAPAASQLLGWFLATSQLERGLYLRSLGDSLEGWFTRDASRCDWGDPTDVPFFRDHGLPDGFEGDLERAAQAVSEDSTRPIQVRDYTRCVVKMLSDSSQDAG